MHAKVELSSHAAEIICNPQCVIRLYCLINYTKKRNKMKKWNASSSVDVDKLSRTDFRSIHKHGIFLKQVCNSAGFRRYSVTFPKA